MDPGRLLHYVADVFDRLGIPYFITGATAANMYGQSRTTRDIDIVTRLPLGNVPDVCRMFRLPDFYVSEDAAYEAVRNHTMFNIIENEDGLKIDVVIPERTAFETSQFNRARRLETAPGHDPYFCSPEDVIVSKMRFFQMGAPRRQCSHCASPGGSTRSRLHRTVGVSLRSNGHLEGDSQASRGSAVSLLLPLHCPHVDSVLSDGR